MRPYSETIPFYSSRSGAQALDEIDEKLVESEQRVLAMNNSYESLEKRSLELEEARQVLIETDVFFKHALNPGAGASGIRERGESFEEHSQPLLGDVESSRLADESGWGAAGFELEFVAGTIDRARMATFERVLWRVLRGNLYMNVSLSFSVHGFRSTLFTFSWGCSTQRLMIQLYQYQVQKLEVKLEEKRRS